MKTETPTRKKKIRPVELPIAHIDQVANHLGVTRDWINRQWLQSDNPPPHFRDGGAVFFDLELLRQWAQCRCLPNRQPPDAPRIDANELTR